MLKSLALSEVLSWGSEGKASIVTVLSYRAGKDRYLWSSHPVGVSTPLELLKAQCSIVVTMGSALRRVLVAVAWMFLMLLPWWRSTYAKEVYPNLWGEVHPWHNEVEIAWVCMYP